MDVHIPILINDIGGAHSIYEQVLPLTLTVIRVCIKPGALLTKHINQRYKWTPINRKEHISSKEQKISHCFNCNINNDNLKKQN